MKTGHWQALLLAVSAGLIVSGCGMGTCGAGDNRNNDSGHMGNMGNCSDASANPGAGPGGASGDTAYFIETISNASSVDGNGANVDLTVYLAAASGTPIAHDGDGSGGGQQPPYYAKTQVALASGQTVYLRGYDAGGWGGYYSLRIRTAGFLGDVSTGTAGHPDVFDTANGALPPGGADDVYTGATPLLLDVVHDHGFWPVLETDWSVFTAP